MRRLTGVAHCRAKYTGSNCLRAVDLGTPLSGRRWGQAPRPWRRRALRFREPRVTISLNTEAFMAQNPLGNPKNRPNPKEKLVKVLDTERESEALVVSGLLDSAGIDNDVTATDAAQNMYRG